MTVLGASSQSGWATSLVLALSTGQEPSGTSAGAERLAAVTADEVRISRSRFSAPTTTGAWSSATAHDTRRRTYRCDPHTHHQRHLSDAAHPDRHRAAVRRTGPGTRPGTSVAGPVPGRGDPSRLRRARRRGHPHPLRLIRIPDRAPPPVRRSTTSPLRGPADRDAVRLRCRPRLGGLPADGPQKPLSKPVTVTREYITAVRTLLEQREGVSFDGLEHSTHATLPDIAAPDIEIGCGVLRPAMARAAGQAADVAITWLTPPSYIEDTLAPTLHQSAADSGRPTPRVATVVHAAVARKGRDMPALAHRAASPHLSSDHYTDMLRRAGIPARPDNSRNGAELLVSSGTFVSGTPEQVAEGLDRYRAARRGRSHRECLRCLQHLRSRCRHDRPARHPHSSGQPS